MKLLDEAKKLKAESIPILYIFLLSILIGWSYHQKSLARDNDLAKKQELTIKNKSDAVSAFLACDEVYFSKLNTEDFIYLSRGEVLKDSWTTFFKKSILSHEEKLQDVPKSCLNLLTTLAHNNIKTSYIFIIHELIEKARADLIDKVLGTNIIPNIIISGAVEQMQNILAHWDDHEVEVEIYAYKLHQDSIKNFLKLIEKYNGVLKLEVGKKEELQLEEYKAGEYYPLCGLISDVSVKLAKDGSYLEKVIKACRKESIEPFVKIIAIDNEWLEIMFVYDVSLGFQQVDEGMSTRSLYLETDERLRRSYLDIGENDPLPPLSLPHYFVQRKTVTTPFVVTDGKFQIALKEMSVSLIKASQDFMVIENINSSCDNKDLMPVVEVNNKLDQQSVGDLEKKSIYKLPKNFNLKNIKFKKNYYGSFNWDYQCGT